MSGPLADGGPRTRWAKPRPVVVLALLLGIVIVAALLTPETLETAGKGGLTTYATAPDGAGIVYDLSHRLGWDVARREVPLDSVPADTTIQAFLDPAEPSGSEVHRVLEGVRHGGALLVVGEVPGLADSLHYATDHEGIMVTLERHRSAACEKEIAGEPFAVAIVEPLAAAITWRAPPPSPPVDLGDVFIEGSSRIAAEGVQLGAGRVGIIATADLASNKVVRTCRWNFDARFIAMLEYLSVGTHHRTLVVFDEYDHGYGIHPGSFRAMGMFIESSSLGRALAQAMLGGLVLLFAAAPRPIPPRDPERIARRSPLEQADALAHAYASVGGTRTIALRLLGGVRRRSMRARLPGDVGEEAFLALVVAAHPACAADAATVSRALREPIPDSELSSVGEALGRIEAALSIAAPSSHRIP